MKMDMIRALGVVAVVVCVVAVAGCRQKSESEPTGTAGVAERTGAALDKAAKKTVEATSTAAEKTVEAAKATATATKDVAGQVVEKTGEARRKPAPPSRVAGARHAGVDGAMSAACPETLRRRPA